MEVRYTTDTACLSDEAMAPFCVGWRTKPHPQALRQALLNSSCVVLAFEGNRLIGFVNALSDGVIAAYIPLLEVLPEFQGRGIGSELLRRMLLELDDMYMVDLLCDVGLAPFYERRGLVRVTGMARRNFDALADLSEAKP